MIMLTYLRYMKSESMLVFMVYFELEVKRLQANYTQLML